MNSTADIDDYAAIRAVIQHYIEGARTGSGATMKPAFHADATIYGYVGEELFSGPIQGLFDWNDRNGAAKALVWEIAHIDLVGTVAAVRLETDRWTGHRFTDFFTLLKQEGRWQIMNKVFHLHA